MIIASLLSGCDSGNTQTGAQSKSRETGDTTLASAQHSETAQRTDASTARTDPSAAALGGEDELYIEKTDRPLTVMFDSIDTAYTPFSPRSSYDTFMDDITGVRLMETSRSGKVVMKGAQGEKLYYGGKAYDYNGIADTEVTYDEESDTTLYTIRLRGGVRFADGVTLDADDVIFTLYTLLDPGYTGTLKLIDMKIIGAANYRYDSEIAETLTQEDINSALESDEVKELITQRVVIPALREEYENVVTLYDDSAYDMYTSEHPDPNELFVFFYSPGGEYEVKPGAAEKDVINDIAAMYGGNYRLLGSILAGEEDFYRKSALKCAIDYLTQENDAAGSINDIKGIKKLGDYSLTVAAYGRSSELTRALADMVVAPLHYYGDEDSYDYSANKFGFRKGNAAAVLSKNAGMPMGAGPYCFSSLDGGTVTLTACEKYFRGKPVTEQIAVTADPTLGAVEAIAGSQADIGFTNGSAQVFDELDEVNRSLERVQMTAQKSSGYGYIGINAASVNVGGSPLSHESVMLRYALAAAISYYKDGSLQEYFGVPGKSTEVPISGTVTINALNDSNTAPYFLSDDGEPVFTVEMTENERLSVLKAVCLKYLRAAGYTVEDDKITSAPEGGRTEFSVLVAGNMTGSHPSYSALTNASALLLELGIKLNVRDLTDTAVADEISTGRYDLWAGVWNDSLRTMYLGGLYGINDERLTQYITDAENALEREELESAYKSCYELMITEYAAEIPFYKRENYTAFSTLRIDMSTLPENMTGFYGWENEIEKVRMK